jgi:hypothetical protein
MLSSARDYSWRDNRLAGCSVPSLTFWIDRKVPCLPLPRPRAARITAWSRADMKDELDDWEALCRDENSFAYLISAKDTASAVPRYPLDWVVLG